MHQLPRIDKKKVVQKTAIFFCQFAFHSTLLLKSQRRNACPIILSPRNSYMNTICFYFLRMKIIKKWLIFFLIIFFYQCFQIEFLSPSSKSDVSGSELTSDGDNMFFCFFCRKFMFVIDPIIAEVSTILCPPRELGRFFLYLFFLHLFLLFLFGCLRFAPFPFRFFGSLFLQLN